MAGSVRFCARSATQRNHGRARAFSYEYSHESVFGDCSVIQVRMDLYDLLLLASVCCGSS